MRLAGWFLLLFLILFSVYFFTSRGGYDGYELENYLNAENIFLHQKISLASGYYNLSGIVNTNDGQEHFVRHGLAQPILEVPFYTLGYFLSQFINLKSPVVETSTSNISSINPVRLMAVSLFNPLVTALTALLVGLIVMELTFRGPSSPRSVRQLADGPFKIGLVAMLVYGLGTMAWPYAVIGMEPLMVLALVLSFFFWLKWKNGVGEEYLVFLGLSLALLINTKSYAWVFSLPFVISVFADFWKKSSSRQQRRLLYQRFLWFCLIETLGFLLFFGFNLYKSGNLFGQDQTSYLANINLGTILVNFLTVAISTGKGLFAYSPILILALLGLKDFIKRLPAESKMIGAITVIILALFLPLWYLSADEMWGPRYLMPLIPFLTIIAVVSFGVLHYSDTSVYRSGTLRLGLLGLLFLVSVFTQLLGVLYWSTTPLKIAFQAGAKSMEEINFNPAFSPLVINTRLLQSTINHLSGKGSLNYQVNQTPTWAGQGGVPKKGVVVDLSKYDNNLVIWPARFFQIK